jgi:hypothetical protein
MPWEQGAETKEQVTKVVGPATAFRVVAKI